MAAGPLRQQRALPLGEPRRPLQRPRLRSPARVCVSYRPSLPAGQKSPGCAGPGRQAGWPVLGSRRGGSEAAPLTAAEAPCRVHSCAREVAGKSAKLRPASRLWSGERGLAAVTAHPLPTARRPPRAARWLPGSLLSGSFGILAANLGQSSRISDLELPEEARSDPCWPCPSHRERLGSHLRGKRLGLAPDLTGHGPNSLRTPPGLHPAADIVGTWRPQGHTGVCAGPRASWQVLSTGRTQRLDSWSWLAGETVAEAEAVGPPDPSGVRLSLLFSTEAWPRLALSPSGEFLL